MLATLRPEARIASGSPWPRSADGDQWDMIQVEGAKHPMGLFLLGLIIGFGGALAVFIYNEGDLCLKLSQQIKQAAQRYRQSS